MGECHVLSCGQWDWSFPQNQRYSRTPVEVPAHRGSFRQTHRLFWKPHQKKAAWARSTNQAAVENKTTAKIPKQSQAYATYVLFWLDWKCRKSESCSCCSFCLLLPFPSLKSLQIILPALPLSYLFCRAEMTEAAFFAVPTSPPWLAIVETRFTSPLSVKLLLYEARKRHLFCVRPPSRLLRHIRHTSSWETWASRVRLSPLQVLHEQ